MFEEALMWYGLDTFAIHLLCNPGIVQEVDAYVVV